jgi:hypothetical protein
MNCDGKCAARLAAVTDERNQLAVVCEALMQVVTSAQLAEAKAVVARRDARLAGKPPGQTGV